MIDQIQTLVPVIKFAIYTGVFAAVLFGGVKLGWKYAPWIIGIGFLIFLLS
jgi:hypothetical protein